MQLLPRIFTCWDKSITHLVKSIPCLIPTLYVSMRKQRRNVKRKKIYLLIKLPSDATAHIIAGLESNHAQKHTSVSLIIFRQYPHFSLKATITKHFIEFNRRPRGF